MQLALANEYKYAKAFEDTPVEGEVYLTAPLVNLKSANRHSFDSCMDEMKRDFGRACFDFVRADPRFAEIASKL